MTKKTWQRSMSLFCTLCLRVWRSENVNTILICRFLFGFYFLTHCLPVPFVCLTPPVLPIRVSGLSVVQATRHRRDGLTAVGAQPRRIAEQPWNEGTQRLTRCTELCEWTACSMCVGPFPVAAGAQPHRKNSSVRTTARSQPRQCKAAQFTP